MNEPPDLLMTAFLKDRLEDFSRKLYDKGVFSVDLGPTRSSMSQLWDDVMDRLSDDDIKILGGGDRLAVPAAWFSTSHHSEYDQMENIRLVYDPYNVVEIDDRVEERAFAMIPPGRKSVSVFYAETKIMKANEIAAHILFSAREVGFDIDWNGEINRAIYLSLPAELVQAFQSTDLPYRRDCGLTEISAYARYLALGWFDGRVVLVYQGGDKISVRFENEKDKSLI